jgi:hypothetical protein
MLLRPLLACTLATCLLLECPVAHADPGAAEALFREGRALLDRGELASACEKLEASNALDPSAGTLLNLAACRLKQGKTATAWSHFLAAERIAQTQNRREQAVEAKRRAAELEPNLSTLTLSAPGAPPGLRVSRAGEPLPAASFGVPVPIDPGPVLIEASAPGYEVARLEVSISASGARHALVIPPLRKLSVALPAPSVASASQATARENASQETRGEALPWTIGGVGAGALVAGGVLGALALSSDSKVVDICQNGHGSREDCTDIKQRRDGQALASTVCVGVGVIGVAVAAIWLLTGRSGRPPSAWSYQGEVTRASARLQLRVGF